MGSWIMKNRWNSQSHLFSLLNYLKGLDKIIFSADQRSKNKYFSLFLPFPHPDPCLRLCPKPLSSSTPAPSTKTSEKLLQKRFYVRFFRISNPLIVNLWIICIDFNAWKRQRNKCKYWAPIDDIASGTIPFFFFYIFHNTVSLWYNLRRGEKYKAFRN